MTRMLLSPKAAEDLYRDAGLDQLPASDVAPELGEGQGTRCTVICGLCGGTGACPGGPTCPNVGPCDRPCFGCKGTGEVEAEDPA